MADTPTQRPTDAELAILAVLWERGPSTVREVHERLAADGGVGYTTVLKLLQIMKDKQLVRRDDTSRAHVYAAAVDKQPTLSRLIADLADRAFAGSTGRLVMQALSARPASARELAEIRRLLDELSGAD
jgi:predicted transcriptional regulator